MSVHIREIRPRDLAPILHLTQIIPEAPSWTIEDFRRLTSIAISAGSNGMVQQGITALASTHQIPTDQRPTYTALIRQAWIAEANRLLLGLIVVQCLKLAGESSESSQNLASPECELESILVDPSARRGGIGQQLLSQAIIFCQQQEASVLRLEVRSSNRSAIRLYEKNGFRAIGLRPRYYALPDEDALLMQLTFPLL